MIALLATIPAGGVRAVHMRLIQARRVVLPKTAYLCISTADVTGYTHPNGWDWSTQTRERANIGNVKPARECVKIISIDTAKTPTTKDDVKKLVS